MSYIRYFMPMISEANGYGFKGRRPAGRSIVEERSHNCKLTVWAQDLRAETHYGIFMLFEDGNRYAGIGMGNLPVDEKGKGEMRREFGQEELDGFKLADIVGVAVLAKDTAGVISPLCGYRAETVSWRHMFYEYTRAPAYYGQENAQAPATVAPVDKELPVQADAEPTVDMPPEMLPIAEPAPMVEEAPDPEETMPMEEEPVPEEDSPAAEEPMHTDENPTQDEPMHIDKIPPPDESMEETPSPDEQPPEEYESPPPESWQEPEPVHDPPLPIKTSATTPTHPRQHHSLEAIFASKERITPFQRQSRKTNWVRFTLSDRVPPPTNRPHLFEDPFIRTALEEHGHLILGIPEDPGPRRHIIGVPGKFDQGIRHKARKLGFTQFKRYDSATQSNNAELGYWLMFITT